MDWWLGTPSANHKRYIAGYHHKVVRSGMGTVFRYGNRFGYQPLREHLVRRLESFGIGAKPNQILMTQGANSAMDLVIRYFVPPGATVLVDDPGYYLLFGKLKLADAKIIGVLHLYRQYTWDCEISWIFGGVGFTMTE